MKNKMWNTITEQEAKGTMMTWYEQENDIREKLVKPKSTEFR